MQLKLLQSCGQFLRPKPILTFGGTAILSTGVVSLAVFGTISIRNQLSAAQVKSLNSGVAVLYQSVTTQLSTIPIPSPWPEIHEHARLAQVPVFMYHDILPEKEVFFDVTPEELAADFEFLKTNGVTPVSLLQLVTHLRTGIPLPEKPVLLTFDDGYGGHYEYVYPLLKQYGYPALFSIYTDKMERQTGRSSITWEQLQAMAADPLVTIASHSVTHPNDLRVLSEKGLNQEIIASKRLLEAKLDIPIHYFTYPVGKSDERVRDWVAKAGYEAALAMDDWNEQFANESEDLLRIARFGQSRLEDIAPQAWGGHPPARTDGGFDFTTPIRKQAYQVGRTSVLLITGGKPTTIHADSRYQVSEIIAGTEAVAAVDGGFFSLQYLDSNVMIGPVLSHLSQNAESFVAGNDSENSKLRGRPLVLISPQQVQFIPFDPNRHNHLAGIRSEMKSVTDAFVASAWLVKDSQPQPRESFGDLYGFDAIRFRAFWGINQAGQPVIGVSTTRTDSVTLGKVLHELGFRDAVMLDSGASSSLVYKGESLVGYIPRPVPHAVVLLAPNASPSVVVK